MTKPDWAAMAAVLRAAQPTTTEAIRNARRNASILGVTTAEAAERLRAWSGGRSGR